MHILHIVAWNDDPQRLRFPALAEQLSRSGEIGQTVILPPKNEDIVFLSEMRVPFRTAPFGGLFDLQTGVTIRNVIQILDPHVIHSYGSRAAAFVPKDMGDRAHHIRILSPRESAMDKSPPLPRCHTLVLAAGQGALGARDFESAAQALQKCLSLYREIFGANQS